MVEPVRAGVADQVVTLHLVAEDAARLSAAADAAGTSVDDFLLEAAMRRTDEVLDEHLDLALDAESWDELVAAMEAPARRISEVTELFDRTEPLAQRLRANHPDDAAADA